MNTDLITVPADTDPTGTACAQWVRNDLISRGVTADFWNDSLTYQLPEAFQGEATEAAQITITRPFSNRPVYIMPTGSYFGVEITASDLQLNPELAIQRLYTAISRARKH